MDKRNITAALNYLIAAPNYSKLVSEMTGIIERWDVQPMAYGGQFALLNSLLDVGLESRDAFEQLLKLAERKRKLAPQTKRTDYQRDLMRDRRARMAKALELSELTSGPLAASDRAERSSQLQTRWAEARQKFLDDKAPQPWALRNIASREFWEQLDETLNTNLRTARRINPVN